MSTSILLLDTGGGVFGPIAEALATHLLFPEVSIVSSSLALDIVNTMAVEVMGEWQIDCSGYAPRAIESIELAHFERIICLTPDAVKACHGVPARKIECWGFSPESWNQAQIREVRDTLFQHMSDLSQRISIEPGLGIIGGSGFYNLPGVEDIREVLVTTPFGLPSDALFVGRLHGKRVVFLPRHGRTHHLLPSEVNARANLYAMKRLGVTRVLSVSAVGSLREHIEPGHIVFPRQFIDRALGRSSTFFGGGVVAHVSLADPVCNGLASQVAACAKQEPGVVHEEGTYLCMEGPQFSTRAESHLYRSWGADIIGMTNATEAKVAREAGVCYATLAFPTDYDCWRTSTEEAKVEEIIAVLRANVAKGQRVVSKAIEVLEAAAPCNCHHALDTGLMTPREAIPLEARFKLHALLGKKERVGA